MAPAVATRQPIQVPESEAARLVGVYRRRQGGGDLIIRLVNGDGVEGITDGAVVAAVLLESQCRA